MAMTGDGSVGSNLTVSSTLYPCVSTARKTAVYDLASGSSTGATSTSTAPALPITAAEASLERVVVCAD